MLLRSGKIKPFETPRPKRRKNISVRAHHEERDLSYLELGIWWWYTIDEIKEEMQIDEHDPGSPNLVPRRGKLGNKLPLIQQWIDFGDPAITRGYLERKERWRAELV